MYAALGWTYSGQRYELPLDGGQLSKRIVAWLAARGWEAGRPTLGVNVGAGNVFANKMWPAQRTAEVIRLALAAQPNLQVLLAGRPGRSADHGRGCRGACRGRRGPAA